MATRAFFKNWTPKLRVHSSRELRRQPFRFPRTQTACAIALLILVYFSVYALLSSQGAYVPVVSGEVRWNYGFGVIDQYIWMPRFVYYRRYLALSGEIDTRANWLGYVYFPLLVIDRVYWHPTQYIFGKDLELLSNIMDGRDEIASLRTPSYAALLGRRL